MVKCIDCEHLLQGHVILRRCNGKYIFSGHIEEEELVDIYRNQNSGSLVDNDFECEEGKMWQDDVNPPFANKDCILLTEIDEERECKDFKS